MIFVRYVNYEMYQEHKEDSRVQIMIVKINNIGNTIKSLEESLMITRSLEAERWLRYSNLKAKNKIMMDDLRKANKRNKNMLSMWECLNREEQ